MPDKPKKPIKELPEDNSWELLCSELQEMPDSEMYVFTKDELKEMIWDK